MSDFGEDAWQKGIEEDLARPLGTTSNCPICHKKSYSKFPSRECICNKRMAIFIPNDSHIHIQCPVHGDVIVYGSNITY